ncbi:MAG: class I SAM-dependent methyltransferase [Bacteriovoracaceae bacterium]
MSDFDYDSIPVGYYDDILENGSPIRKFWHWLKFNSVEKVVEARQKEAPGTLLDIGCFAGSFLKTLNLDHFEKLHGVDILQNQIDYASETHGHEKRTFQCIPDFKQVLDKPISDRPFDFITVIEVIEHLHLQEIRDLIQFVDVNLKPGGQLIMTTPNYLSIWPLLEYYLNHFADITYEEQHITKFTYFNFDKKLGNISPLFKEKYDLEFKTSTHTLTPFLAPLSYDFSQRLSGVITPRKWSFPFGPLVLAVFKKK